jgi:threonine dehydrogenase-like Zn-dependent dehydrogenase
MKKKKKWPKAIFYDSRNTLFAWDTVWIKASSTFYGCFESVRPGGKISLVGVFPDEKVGFSLRDMLRRNLQIKAGRANLIHMDRLLSLIDSGKLDLTPLITHRMPLNEAAKAYRLFGTRSDHVLKIILKP